VPRYDMSNIDMSSRKCYKGGMNDTETAVDSRLLKYLPLTPAVFHIMLALSNGQQHGYAIMKEVAEQTDGELRLGTGKLFYSIQRMLDEELIEEIEPPPGETPERGRRSYDLTELGHDLLEAEALRLHKAVRLAQRRHVLKGAEDGGER